MLTEAQASNQTPNLKWYFDTRKHYKGMINLACYKCKHNTKSESSFCISMINIYTRTLNRFWRAQGL